MVRYVATFATAMAVLILASPALNAQGAPEWKYGLSFKVRKAGQPDFDKNTPRFGSEFYIDKTNNQGIYITETGALSVVPSVPLLATSASETKAPKWLHGLELKVRKAGEAEFSTNSKKFGLECFRDENNGLLVYLSETGSIAAIKSAKSETSVEAKAPAWLFGLELKARKGSEADFTDKTAKFGLECFRDENNGNLLFIDETGTIAVMPPAASPLPKEPRAPRWLHGLSFRVRMASQSDFTNDTPNYGAEIFKDENTGSLIYIGEKGALSVAGGAPASNEKTKAPKWLQGVVLKVRKANEEDFNKETRQYGIEIFRDENTSNLVYVCETAALAVTK